MSFAGLLWLEHEVEIARKRVALALPVPRRLFGYIAAPGDPRLRSALACAVIRSNRILVHPGIVDIGREPPDYLQQAIRAVLIHEVVHCAVGPIGRYHGPEFWAACVEVALALNLPFPAHPTTSRTTPNHPKRWPLWSTPDSFALDCAAACFVRDYDSERLAALA